MKYLSSYIIVVFIISTICSCHSKMYYHSSLNKESTDANGNLMLLGRCTEERLQQAPFNSWFVKNYNDYSVDTITAEKMKSALQHKQFKIFMGTWCGDSRREVPRMFKILNYCGVQSSRIELIMLDDRESVYKQSPDHEERGMNIHRVPDFIVFGAKKEMGRIVESPIISLEKDLDKITNGEGYSPNYQAVSFLIDFFRKNNPANIGSGYSDLENKLKPLASASSELNTYGYVLMAAGEVQKAGIVFKLNTQLYPDKSNVFDSLGEYYFKTGNRSLAKENYQKVLQMEPDNKNAKKMIAQLQ
jgi:tetratricopeptide (TPR) repeat protein